MQAMQSSHTLFLIFTTAVVISVVVQAAVFVAIFVVVFRNIAKLRKVIEDLAGKAHPVIADVREIVQDVSPKVRTISSQVVEITSAVRDQTLHVNSTVDEVVDKTRAQAGKVDDMVSAVLGSIAHAGSTVQAGVTRPVRKVGGVLHGIRIGLETLFNLETNTGAKSATRAQAGAGARASGYTAEAAPAASVTEAPFRTEVKTTVLDNERLDTEREDEKVSVPAQTIQPPPTTSSSR